MSIKKGVTQYKENCKRLPAGMTMVREWVETKKASGKCPKLRVIYKK